MSFLQISALFVVLALFPRAYGMPYGNTNCKSIPGDPGWPSSEDWESLNRTVDGRLISTVPIATICHGSDYHQGQCQELQQAWPFANVHAQAPGEFLAPYFQNQSCEPFTSQGKPCELGNYARYSINVSTVSHVQAGIQFARENKIRLTIKNTGHDLLGKSTGRGALSLWTHHMNTIDFIDRYDGAGNYHGPAVRLGAGVLTSEVFAAANNSGFRVITGTCPDVGVAGGFTPGGGHGIFTSSYGMAADSVLEWEIVTAQGEHIMATPTAHADLYWALSGGGAGTFAVVISMVTRIYPDGIMGGARISFDVDMAGGIEEFWDGVAAFQFALGSVVDAGAVVSYLLTPTALDVYGISMPDRNASMVDQVLLPVISAMENLGISLNITKSTHPGFLDFYDQYFLQAVTTTPNAQITGGRLVPRSIIESRSGTKSVTQAFRNAAEAGFGIVCDAVNADRVPMNDNAVFLNWRSTLLTCIFVKTWDFSIPWTEMATYQTNLTKFIMPTIEAATPGGGAYLNEANFQQPNWQDMFYGTNYRRLKGIKDRVDPLGVFYARTAVGSEEWAEDTDGRLCQT
ncbi:hypothetical protein F4782DRAFT_535708 [Xylaria castorea]|nr:hypothetical protein F4782DRAFT_535708 [Xylaria castorea]